MCEFSGFRRHAGSQFSKRQRGHELYETILSVSKQEWEILVGNRDILFLTSDTGSLNAIEFLENFISPKLQGRKADLILQRTLELIQPVP